MTFHSMLHADDPYGTLLEHPPAGPWKARTRVIVILEM